MKQKFQIGDIAIIWRDNGAGIYDGNVNYVREIVNPRPSDMRYGLSDANEGEARGYMPQGLLLSEAKFQSMIDSGEVERTWKGDPEKLQGVLKRWEKAPSELESLRLQVATLTSELNAVEWREKIAMTTIAVIEDAMENGPLNGRFILIDKALETYKQSNPKFAALVEVMRPFFNHD